MGDAAVEEGMTGAHPLRDGDRQVVFKPEGEHLRESATPRDALLTVSSQCSRYDWRVLAMSAKAV